MQGVTIPIKTTPIRTTTKTKNSSVPCELCSIGSLCIPRLLTNSLEDVVHRKQSVMKDHVIVSTGMLFTKFYVVHSGALKTYVTAPDGTEQINGFYLPGDIVGLDAIFTKHYNNNVKALTNTMVCELHYDELMSLVESNKSVREFVFKLLSSDIYHYQRLLLSYSQKKADERLATFIYTLYLRYEQRGHTSLNIKLAMSRTDIANYLGLTIETISRTLSKFQEKNVLTVKGKYIFIKDLTSLIALSN